MPLGGIEVRVCQWLAGQKFAVQMGDGPIHVSPAMWDLMRHAGPDELEGLLRAIPLKWIPEFKPDFSGELFWQP